MCERDRLFDAFEVGELPRAVANILKHIDQMHPDPERCKQIQAALVAYITARALYYDAKDDADRRDFALRVSSMLPDARDPSSSIDLSCYWPASGKHFQPNELTAASRKLPLNSEAKVTNLETGKSTNVTITDRGPDKKSRVLDLSPKAAKRIGVTTKQGVVPVAVEPVAPPPNAKPREAEADRPG